MSKSKKPPSGGNTPPKVTGLVGSALDATSIGLSWDAVANAHAYWIYRDGIVGGITVVPNYVDKPLIPHTAYRYEVAVEINKLVGPKSDAITVMTP